jgi:hypothetical protein
MFNPESVYQAMDVAHVFLLHTFSALAAWRSMHHLIEASEPQNRYISTTAITDSFFNHASQDLLLKGCLGAEAVLLGVGTIGHITGLSGENLEYIASNPKSIFYAIVLTGLTRYGVEFLTSKSK